MEAKVLFTFILVLGFLFYLSLAAVAILAALGGREYKRTIRISLGIIGVVAICLWVWMLEYVVTKGIPF